jgi:hypothetical protein
VPRAEHPPLRWFADRVDGKLAAARGAALDAHLATGCAACGARDAKLRSALAALRAGPLEAPPRALRLAASRLHVEARIAAVVTNVQEFVARLVFDGRASPALALRSAPGDERRLLWAVGDELEIDACLVTGARAAELRGQIVPRADRSDAIGGAVGGTIALRSGRRVHRARLDRAGRFEFPRVPAGMWTLEGCAGERRFRVPAFIVERAG